MLASIIGFIALAIMIVGPVVAYIWIGKWFESKLLFSPNQAYWAPILLAVLLVIEFFFVVRGDFTLYLLYLIVGYILLTAFSMLVLWTYSSILPYRNKIQLIIIILATFSLAPWMGHEIIYTWQFGMAHGNNIVKCKTGIRDISSSLESYYTDHHCYPPAVNANGEIIPFATEGIPISAGFVSWILTTPKVYLASIPYDPFSEKESNPTQRTYRYATNGRTGFILASRGPDWDFDMDLAAYITDASCDITRYLTQFGGTQVEYDPTNGLLSSGDVFRTGP